MYICIYIYIYIRVAPSTARDAVSIWIRATQAWQWWEGYSIVQTYASTLYNPRLQSYEHILLYTVDAYI